ncbi:MAG: hypothetical protein IPN93_04365 [Bacteroidetes bacterium]|nr:hypothetical protein [Bacteroidota bacterium]
MKNKKLYLIFILLIANLSCNKKTNNSLFTELKEIEKSKYSGNYLLKMSGIDSVYYFEEYPDGNDFKEFANNIYPAYKKNAVEKYYNSFVLEGRYSLYILFQNNTVTFVPINYQKNLPFIFVSGCGFSKLFNTDTLDFKPKEFEKGKIFYFVKNININRPKTDCVEE